MVRLKPMASMLVTTNSRPDSLAIASKNSLSVRIQPLLIFACGSYFARRTK